MDTMKAKNASSDTRTEVQKLLDMMIVDAAEITFGSSKNLVTVEYTAEDFWLGTAQQRVQEAMQDAFTKLKDFLPQGTSFEVVTNDACTTRRKILGVNATYIASAKTVYNLHYPSDVPEYVLSHADPADPEKATPQPMSEAELLAEKWRIGEITTQEYLQGVRAIVRASIYAESQETK